MRDDQDTLLRIAPALLEPLLEDPNPAHHLLLGFLVRQILVLQKIANRLLVLAAQFRVMRLWGRNLTEPESFTRSLHNRADNDIVVACQGRRLRFPEFGEVTILFGVVLLIVDAAAMTQKSDLHSDSTLPSEFFI